jgi:hypothetical protein
MGQLYKATFPEGSKVQVIPKAALETFVQGWKYHHKLRPDQMEYAGTTATVKEVTFYHGGDQLYVLENVPGIWNEPCLETAPRAEARLDA